MDFISDDALRLVIAQHSNYIPPHLRHLPDAKKVYLENLRRGRSVNFYSTIEEFASTHLGPGWNGDLSVYAERLRRKSKSTGYGSSEVSATAAATQAGSGVKQRDVESRGGGAWQGRGELAREKKATSRNFRYGAGSPTAIPRNCVRNNDSLSDHDRGYSKYSQLRRRTFNLRGGNKIVIEKQPDPAKWFSTMKEQGKLSKDGDDIGIATYVPKNIETFDFSQLEYHQPDYRYLKFPGVPIDNLRPTIPAEERIKQFLADLNPTYADPSLTDSFFYPPTRRCDPLTVGIPGSNQRPRPSWMPTDVVMCSLFPKDSEYPVPKHHDGLEVDFPKPGPRWLKSAWEYDVFPLYRMPNGVWWDYRNVVEKDDGLPRDAFEYAQEGNLRSWVNR